MKSSILSRASNTVSRAELESTPRQLQEIGEDAAANAAALTREAVSAAKNVGGQLADLARDKADTLSHIVVNDLDRIKSYVKEQPVKGLGIAFAAGALAALFIGRRS